MLLVAVGLVPLTRATPGFAGPPGDPWTAIVTREGEPSDPIAEVEPRRADGDGGFRITEGHDGSGRTTITVQPGSHGFTWVESRTAGTPSVLSQATGTASPAVASVGAPKRDPRRLYVPAFGRALAGSVAVVCPRAGETSARTAQCPRIQSGRRYRVASPMARPDSCNVTAAARGAGAIHAQILG